MPARFTVLASGSSGNASLLEVDEFALLIDCGLGPRVLSWRLAAIGRSWKSVSAVVLTHTHGDHWHALTLEHLRRLSLPLIAHPFHHDYLSRYDAYTPLRHAGLTRTFAEGVPFEIAPSLTCRPHEVPHDSEPTFAFRFDHVDKSTRTSCSLGYVSDVGHATSDLTRAFLGVDVLAIEFNHDVQMQRMSGRPKLLIDRVLGKHGHLSNEQAAEFATTIARSGNGGFRHLVQLHLSRECNTLELAAAAGRAAMASIAPEASVITATQHAPTNSMDLIGQPLATRHVSSSLPRTLQPTLPGLGTDAAPTR